MAGQIEMTTTCIKRRERSYRERTRQEWNRAEETLEKMEAESHGPQEMVTDGRWMRMGWNKRNTQDDKNLTREDMLEWGDWPRKVPKKK